MTIKKKKSVPGVTLSPVSNVHGYTLAKPLQSALPSSLKPWKLMPVMIHAPSTMSHTPILEYSRTTVAREQKHRRNDAITHQSTCARQSDRQRTNKRLHSANYVACTLLCQGVNQENKPWFENNLKFY